MYDASTIAQMSEPLRESGRPATQAEAPKRLENENTWKAMSLER